MKGSLTTSAIVHAALLAAALVTIGAPEPFEVSNTETLPVELVPIEELTQIQQGDKSAPVADRSAPVPTTRPDIVPDAQNVGNNTADIEAPPTPETKPSQNVAVAAPKQEQSPAPVVDAKPTEVKEIVKEETAPPVPQEVAALPQVKPEPAPKPVEALQPDVSEAAPKEQPQTEAPAEIPVPANVPKPAARPAPPTPPQEAKKPETRPAEKPSEKKPAERKQESAKAQSSKESDFNADDVAALLNKQQPSGGGAKRSNDQAALGGKTNTGGSKLSQTEIDALRGIIQKNWQIIPGMADAGDVRIRVVMKLDRDGSIIGKPQVEAVGGTEGTRRALSGGAYRAVLRSAPFTSLPADKYDAWNEVIVNFDPSDLI